MVLDPNRSIRVQLFSGPNRRSFLCLKMLNYAYQVQVGKPQVHFGMGPTFWTSVDLYYQYANIFSMAKMTKSRPNSQTALCNILCVIAWGEKKYDWMTRQLFVSNITAIFLNQLNPLHVLLPCHKGWAKFVETSSTIYYSKYGDIR